MTALTRRLLLLLPFFMLAGCAAPTAADYQRQGALTVRVLDETLNRDGAPAGLPESFVLDIPKEFFDDDLPSEFRNGGVGIINNDLQLTQMWNRFSRDNTALRPSIDFKTKALLFVYDPDHYNLVRLLGMEVIDGVANPIIWHTNWTLSIGGNENRRKWLAQTKPQKDVPTGKGNVNVAFLQIPRDLPPGQAGVTAVLANGVPVPVPKEP